MPRFQRVRKVAAEDEVLEQFRGWRRGREKSGGVCAEREEAGDADVEQAGVSPVDIQTEREYGVDAREDAEACQKVYVVHLGVPLSEQATRSQEKHHQHYGECDGGLVRG